MKSMTGYGRGSRECAAGQVTVDISAVNSRKQVDLRFAIPREFGIMEPGLRRIVQSRLSRGSLYIAVSCRLAEDGAAGNAGINLAAAGEAYRTLAKLAEQYALNPPGLPEILRVPGVLDDSQDSRYDALKALVEPALSEALDALDASRTQEGERLKADLEARRQRIAAGLAAIEAREPQAMAELAERLRARLAALGMEVAADDERLAKEMVFYADRADIAEELVRLKSHIVKFSELLESGEDCGRELDFLGQEMNREITTLSAKTADLTISGEAMALKVEISKVREQIMNIE